MDFSNKCKVLGELWLYYREEAQTNETWAEFFHYNDIALPLSYGISMGFVERVEDGGLDEYVDDTWEYFCALIDIDVNGEYSDINAAWSASPNPPLEETQAQEEEVKENIEIKKRGRPRKTP